MNANRRILRAAGSVLVAGAVVKIAAIGKEFVVAGIYGRSDAMDAFLAAFLIPNLLINLIAESMNQALIPTLIRVSIREGRESARKLLSSSMLSMCLLLTLASLIMAALARARFPAHRFRFCSPQAGPLHPALLCASPHRAPHRHRDQLHCGAQYGRPVCSARHRAARNAALDGSRARCCSMPVGASGPWCMPPLFGAFAHAAIVAAMMRTHGYPLRLHWYGNNQASREVGRQYVPVLFSSVVASGGLLVDQAMAGDAARRQCFGPGVCQSICERRGHVDGGSHCLRAYAPYVRP